MKLFSTDFSFILLFSTIVSQIAVSNEHDRDNKHREQEYHEWENYCQNIKNGRRDKYEKHLEKHSKNKYNNLKKKNNNS